VERLDSGVSIRTLEQSGIRSPLSRENGQAISSIHTEESHKTFDEKDKASYGRASQRTTKTGSIEVGSFTTVK
jgi:hypothetical protein